MLTSAPIVLAFDPETAEAGASAAANLPGSGGYGLFLLETFLVLGAVCVLAWLVLRFGLRRLALGPAGAPGGPLRVLVRLPLEPRRTLYVVEAAGKHLLLGTSESGPMAVLAELDRDAVLRALGDQPKPRSFLEVLNLKRSGGADKSGG
jgi:flagellar biosynthetic protein FliO